MDDIRGVVTSEGSGLLSPTTTTLANDDDEWKAYTASPSLFSLRLRATRRALLREATRRDAIIILIIMAS